MTVHAAALEVPRGPAPRTTLLRASAGQRADRPFGDNASDPCSCAVPKLTTGLCLSVTAGLIVGSIMKSQAVQPSDESAAELIGLGVTMAGIFSTFAWALAVYAKPEQK